MSSPSQPGLKSFELPLKVPDTLIPYDTRKLPQEYVEICVIGSGASGLCAALEASATRSVLVVTKSEFSDNATWYAQGGIAIAMGGIKNEQSHIEDTIKAGYGLNDAEVVEQIVKEGPKDLQKLLKFGTTFDTNLDDNGQKILSLTKEGGHSKRRILHAGGDATGQEIETSLINAVKRNEYIRIYEQTFVVDLLVDENSVCRGILAMRNGKIFVVWADAVILGTGGIGQIYRETTNPKVASADGHALAYRAGAIMRDLEFMQFHPTTLYLAGTARVLVNEAVRGEGGILRNRLGKRFMPDYDPNAELAPRDIVSRACITEMHKTKDTNVYLDVTHLDIEKLRKRFPSFTKTCEKFDIDLMTELVPVRPTAHYYIGGVKVDINGKTSIERLYAVGELACSSFHGANRLGSNSLLEAVVIGLRAGVCSVNETGSVGKQKQLISEGPTKREDFDADIDDLTNAVKSLMWNMMGVIREKEGLEKALIRLHSWMRYALFNVFNEPKAWELQNMLTIAAPMLESALKREESRGVHFRSDFPEMNDKFNIHIDLFKPK
ncbi:MAG: L-aspartate oxidase [Planctomycetes bacterium]|nr:L-aspartate oxidase [Planctomycetota bacterium]